MRPHPDVPRGPLPHPPLRHGGRQPLLPPAVRLRGGRGRRRRGGLQRVPAGLRGPRRPGRAAGVRLHGHPDHPQLRDEGRAAGGPAPGHPVRGGRLQGHPRGDGGGGEAVPGGAEGPARARGESGSGGEGDGPGPGVPEEDGQEEDKQHQVASRQLLRPDRAPASFPRPAVFASVRQLPLPPVHPAAQPRAGGAAPPPGAERGPQGAGRAAQRAHTKRGLRPLVRRAAGLGPPRRRRQLQRQDVGGRGRGAVRRGRRRAGGERLRACVPREPGPGGGGGGGGGREEEEVPDASAVSRLSEDHSRRRQAAQTHEDAHGREALPVLHLWRPLHPVQELRPLAQARLLSPRAHLSSPSLSPSGTTS